MHPNRLVGLVVTGVGLLQVASVLTGWTGPDVRSVLLACCGVVFLVCGTYATVRYESQPVVTQYGWTTLAMLTGLLTYGAVLVWELAVA